MLPSSPSKGPFLSFIFIVSNVFTGSFLTTSFLAAFYILTPECYKIAIRLITHQFSNCNHTVTCLFMHDSQANLNQEVEDALYLSVICWLGIFSGLQVCQKTNAQKKKEGKYVSKLAIQAVLLCGRLLGSSCVCFEGGHQLYPDDLERNCVSLCGVSGIYISGPPFPSLLCSSALQSADLLLVQENHLCFIQERDFGFVFLPSPLRFSLWKEKHLACCRKVTLEKSLESSKRSAYGKNYVYCGHSRMSVLLKSRPSGCVGGRR